MWYLYLDESGDLGFDFVNKKPSKFFTITILAVKSSHNKILRNCVKKTLNRKLNKHKAKRVVCELKGTHTTLEVKKYFFELVKDIPFSIFSLTLNKRKVFEQLARDKNRVYNYVARLVLDQIKFENAKSQVDLYVDKCKSQEQIKEFNRYIFNQLKAKFNPNVPLNFFHKNSKEIPALQAVDLFSWGIFRSYERKDFEWYDIYKDKVKFNEQYL